MTVFPLGFPSFGANCYLLTSGNHALVVDPALPADTILQAAEQKQVTIDGILLTHGHFDHTCSVDSLRDKLACPLMIHNADAVMLTDGTTNGYYDFYGECLEHRAADRLLTDGQAIPLGEESVTVLHTPGHSPGSVCYVCGEDVLTGDTLFSNSIGRCDLWGGDERAIRASLARLRALPTDWIIYPGHGNTERLGAALDQAAYYL